MNLSLRQQVRLQIPIVIESSLRGMRTLNCVLHLRVGPFKSSEAALRWEEDFIRHAVVEWIAPRRSSLRASRIARGRAVRSLIGAGQAYSEGRGGGPRHLNYEFNEGHVECIPISSLEEQFDIDPLTLSGKEVAADLERHIFEYIKQELGQ